MVEVRVVRKGYDIRKYQKERTEKLFVVVLVNFVCKNYKVTERCCVSRCQGFIES